MDKEQARFYRERWKAVEEIEARERAALTPEERLRQISAVFEFRSPTPEEGREIQEARERWIRLRRAYESRPSER